jgi:hypothetical protein
MAIKGWKNAHSDLAKMRRDKADASRSAMLVSLKKDGSESRMHDAKSFHNSEAEARKVHTNICDLNPGKRIAHNLYVDGKHIDRLGESTSSPSLGIRFWIDLCRETNPNEHL